MSYLIYDIETAYIPWDGKSEKDPALSYADSWKDYQGLGVAVVGCYSSLLDRFIAYASHPAIEAGTEDINDFEQFALDHDQIIGFNSQRFDDLVLAAAGIEITTNYDLLLECWAASGLDPNYDFPEGDNENRKKYGGYKLDILAIANFGRGKIGHGALAPKLWQQGKHNEVIRYCLEDVRLTHELFKLGLKGELWHPGTRKFLQLKHIS